MAQSSHTRSEIYTHGIYTNGRQNSREASARTSLSRETLATGDTPRLNPSERKRRKNEKARCCWWCGIHPATREAGEGKERALRIQRNKTPTRYKAKQNADGPVSPVKEGRQPRGDDERQGTDHETDHRIGEEENRREADHLRGESGAKTRQCCQIQKLQATKVKLRKGGKGRTLISAHLTHPAGSNRLREKQATRAVPIWGEAWAAWQVMS